MKDIASRYKFYAYQVMTEVIDYHHPYMICCICKENNVEKRVRWINAFWTGAYNFRYTCNNPSCINTAKHSFIKDDTSEQV